MEKRSLDENDRVQNDGCYDDLGHEVGPVKNESISMRENPDDSCEELKDVHLQSFLKSSPEQHLAETKKAAIIIEAAVKYTPSYQNEIDCEIFYNEQIQDKFVQAGLVEVSSSFFPLASSA